jgi:hypothetical protein
MRQSGFFCAWSRLLTVCLLGAGCENPTRAPTDVADAGTHEPTPDAALGLDGSAEPPDPRDHPDPDVRHRHRWRPRGAGRCPTFRTKIAYRAGANPPAATALHIGDGWGCATLHDASRYCWVASDNGTRAQSIVARHMPWLEDQWIEAGPDRICVGNSESVRCYRAPEFLTRNWWSDPLPAAPTPVEALSWHVRPADDGRVLDPTPVRHGAWRGCSGELCWGPSDVTPSQSYPHLCHAGNLAVPCAVADVRALEEFEDALPTVGMAMIGDLFACLRNLDGLFCIGASRDGFFGSAAECPPELRGAWPTASGTVPAPNAKCSRKPVRPGPGKYRGNDGFASPRGICFDNDARLDWRYRCFGRIDTPKARFYPIVPGLGDEPSACGISKGKVHCWGAGYSEGAREPVPIRFEVPREDGVGSDGGGPFHEKCAVFKNCGRAATPLPKCRNSGATLSVDDLLSLTRGFEGQGVRVRGALVIAATGWSQVGVTCCPCQEDGITPDQSKGGGSGHFCCPRASSALSITDGTDHIALEGFRCSGDESRMCCDAPVLGQTVVGTGRLVFRTWIPDAGPMWSLAGASLCEPLQ